MNISFFTQKMRQMYAKATRKALFIGGGVFMCVVFIFFSFLGKNGEEVFVKAERGTIEEEVLVTGKTKSEAEVDLGFERSGKVVQARVNVGDRVMAGEVLVMLDQADLRANLRKAEANLAAELVELDAIKRTSAIDYDSAYTSAYTTLKDVYTKADDAIRNNVDRFFDEPTRSAKFQIVFDDEGTRREFNVPFAEERRASAGRREVEDVLKDWNSSLSTLKKGDDLKEAFATAEDNLETMKSFLNDLALTINSLSSYDFRYESTVTGYKTMVSTARSTASLALTNLLTAKEKLETVSSASVSTAALDKVRSQEARVESIRADISSIEADIAKTVLRAPIAGIVTKADVEAGEIVTSGSELITIISDSELRIEANVSEVNIGKVAINNDAGISFDAFPGLELPGKVIYIDPSETVVDGVPTYKVTVSFSDKIPSEIRSGLTTTLHIGTAKREQAIKVPAYAIERKNDRSYVIVKAGEQVTEREVVLGVRGKDGTVEVVSGLEEGEEVVVTN